MRGQPTQPTSERSLEVLRAVMDYWEANLYPPSVRELARSLGISSTSTFYYLNILERDGYIERRSKTGRCWVPVGIRISFEDCPF